MSLPSLIHFIDVFKTILPSGNIFKPKPGGNLDNIYKGISDVIDEVIAEAKKIAIVTDPYLTDMLNDLEKDHGLISNTNLNENERRQFLNAFAFGKNGNGSALFLQGRIRNAGYGLNAGFENAYVSENDPPIDPNSIMGGDFRAYVGDVNAYMGSADAYIGEGNGEIFVDGINTYTIPSDERLNYVFFVGGESSGWMLIHDWDMEKLGTYDWHPNINTLLRKVTVDYVNNLPVEISGTRSLCVMNNGNTEEQEVYPLNNAGIYKAFRFYDLKQDNGFNNSKVGNLFEDNIFDLSGIEKWTLIGDITAEKVSFGSWYGVNYLKSTIVNPLIDKIGQAVLEIGKTYSISGWWKQPAEEGYNNIVIMNGNDVIITQSNTNKSNWNFFEYEFTAADSGIFFSMATANVGLGKEFHLENLIVRELNKNVLPNGDFSDGLTGWTELGTYNCQVVNSNDDFELDNPGEGLPDTYEGVTPVMMSNKILMTLDVNRYLPDDRNGLKSGNILTIGKKYRIQFMGVGPGLGNQNVYCGYSNIVASCNNGDAQSKYITSDFIATDEFIILTSDDQFAYGYWTYWSDISIYELDYFYIKDITPINLFKNPLMLYSTLYWEIGNNSNISIVTDTEGKCLKIERSTTNNPYVSQGYLRNGFKYKLSGYIKTDGICDFSVYVGSRNIYLHVGALDWTYFEVTFNCTSSADILKIGNNATNYGQYVLVNNLSLFPLTSNGDYYCKNEPRVGFLRDNSYNLLSDGNCDDILLTHWTAINNASLTKSTIVTSPVTHIRSLQIENVSTLGAGTRQYCTRTGRKYHLIGKCKVSSSFMGMYIKSGSTVLWTTEDTTDWQDFDIIFEASSYYLYFSHFGGSEYEDRCWIDDLELYEYPPENINGTNTVEKLGRSIDLGDDGLINALNPFDSEFNYNFSISTWFKTASENKNIIESSTFSVSILEGKVVFSINETPISSVDNITETEWNNLVISFDYFKPQNISMFLNGVNQNISDSISYSEVISNTNITFMNCIFNTFFLYKSTLSEEECLSEYYNGIIVMNGGNSNMSLLQGIVPIDIEDDTIFVNNRKVSPFVKFIPNMFDGSNCGIFTVSGSGTDPYINDSEFSNDKSIQFMSGKVLSCEDNSIGNIGDLSNNNIVIRAIFMSASNISVIEKTEDSNNYWKLKTVNNKIIFSIKTTGNTEQNISSIDIGNSGSFKFVELFIDLNTGNSEIFINGINSTYTCSIDGSFSDISNDGYLTVGNGSICAISYISMFRGISWFN